MNHEYIAKYYDEHQDRLHELFQKIEKKIDGRICHSSIIILKIITEIEKIQRYLEIGVHNGGSMSLMLTCPDVTKLYGMDLFEDMYDLNKHLNATKYKTYQYFRRDNLSKNKTISNLEKTKGVNQDINLIQGNTYFDDTEEKFKGVFEGKLDLMFIDGDHTYEGVKNDFHRYSKYVREEGIIVFDDYHLPPIKKFCDELLKNSDNIKLITKFKSRDAKAIDLVVRKLHN